MAPAKALTISLMVKAPVAGQAKSRLAPALSEIGAARLAEAMLRDALLAWRETKQRVVVALTGKPNQAWQRELAEWPQMLQGGGTLGDKLERVLVAGLRESDVAAVVGTDIPDVGPGEVRETQRLLATHDAVLGPAKDGGFYWLALRRCPKGLFSGIPWSSADTFARTKEKLVAAGMRVALLPPRFDVDVPADLSVLAGYLRKHPIAMPHTRAFLASEENHALSVIIAVLNEEQRIGELLRSLQKEAPWAELVLVDGGSSDATLSIAHSIPGVVVLQSEAGRGRQFNVGAAAAMGGTYFFLHADAALPTKSLDKIRQHLTLGDHEAGAFRLKTTYDCRGKKRSWLRPFLPLADLRSRYSKTPYGDQGLFVRASVFHALGGYAEQPLFEDLDLSQRLARRRPLAILPGPMVVSARRFQERPLYYLALMNAFPLFYRLGISPKRLASFYPNPR